MYVQILALDLVHDSGKLLHVFAVLIANGFCPGFTAIAGFAFINLTEPYR